MFDIDVAAAMQRLRAGQRVLREFSEERLTDTCVITIPGESTWDDETGTYTESRVEIWSGPCRVRNPYVNAQRVTGGATIWAVDKHTLSLPLEGTGHIGKGATVTITHSEDGGVPVGHEFIIEAGHYQSQGNARRLPMQSVEHGV